MPVHTCVAEYAWNVAYNYKPLGAFKKTEKIVGILFFVGCTSGGVYVPCIYTHARWELFLATQVFVVLLVLRISSAN